LILFGAFLRVQEAGVIAEDLADAESRRIMLGIAVTDCSGNFLLCASFGIVLRF
jgi:hypothetical protein